MALTVVPLDGWTRGQWFDQTGLPWVNPSPNIRSTLQALLYSGVGLLEATNLSVGRGTNMPFEVVGAPWISDPAGLAQAMNALGLAGVSAQPISFTPSASVHAGQMVHGLRFVVTDRETLRPVRLGLALARELIERYPAHFRPAAIQNLLVNRPTMWALLRGEPLPRIWSWADVHRASFLQRRAAYLIYPDSPSPPQRRPPPEPRATGSATADAAPGGASRGPQAFQRRHRTRLRPAGPRANSPSCHQPQHAVPHRSVAGIRPAERA